MEARTALGMMFTLLVLAGVLVLMKAGQPLIVSTPRDSSTQSTLGSSSESPASFLKGPRSFQEAAVPAAPVWPLRFQQDFSEVFRFWLLSVHLSPCSSARALEPVLGFFPTSYRLFQDTYFVFFTLTTGGRYYYDYAEKRVRVDRENGVGDRYCGSAMAGYNTPCSHVVFEGMRYLVFPKEKYCCKCCSDEQGCGVVRPDWLKNATYLGHDYIFGILTTKWNQPGLQNNYYWQAFDDVPVRLNMEYVSQMTFNHSSFSTPTKFDDSLFELPSSLDVLQRGEPKPRTRRGEVGLSSV